VDVGRALAFSFLNFAGKKVPAVAGAFFCLFAGVFEGGFGECAFFWWCFCGEFVVDSWWIVVG
jgi:hypothetical protein